LKPPDPEKNGPPRAWVRTYYPGVADPEAASNILVLPGGEVADVELKLLAIPTHAVRGVVVNPDGTPAPKVTMALGEAFSTTALVSKSDGTFEFPAVTEGEWRVSAEAQRDAVKLRAVEWIDVKGHDLENVKLRLAAPLVLRGKMIVDAPKDTPALRPGPMLLSLRGGRSTRNGDLGPMGAALINANSLGNFVVEGAYPGFYRLAPMLQPPSPPYYLDAVLVGGADLTTQEVELSSDATISVVYKADGGSVLGRAENCASGGVLLVPVDPARRRPGFSRSGPCDSSGQYEVHAVRPGDYYALAFAGNGPVLAVDEALLSQGVKVTVRAGEASLADLKAVTRPVF